MRAIVYVAWYAVSVFLLFGGLVVIYHGGAPMTKNNAPIGEILPSMLLVALGFGIFVVGYRCGARANRIRKGKQ